MTWISIFSSALSSHPDIYFRALRPTRPTRSTDSILQLPTRPLGANMSSICTIVRDSKTKEATSFSFDPKKLVVSEGRKLNKGKFCNVRYNGSDLYIETPELHSPTGVSSFEDEKKRTMFVSCRGHDEREDVRLFVEALNSVQDRIIDQVSNMKLLGDKVSRDTVAGLMSPMVKVSDQYPPAFRVNLPFSDDGKAQFDAFKKVGRATHPADIGEMDVRGAAVKVIFVVTSVWVVNKNWGISIKAKQLLIKPSTFHAPAAGVSCFADEEMGSDDEAGERDEGDRVASDSE